MRGKRNKNFLERLILPLYFYKEYIDPSTGSRRRQGYGGHRRMSGAGNPLVVRIPVGRLEPFELN